MGKVLTFVSALILLAYNVILLTDRYDAFIREYFFTGAQHKNETNSNDDNKSSSNQRRNPAANASAATYTNEFTHQRNGYIGCYLDKKEDRIMPPSALMRDIGVSACRSYCAKEGYTYAGLQNGKECFCGNEYDRHGIRPENECNMGCTNGSGICGGVHRMDIFWSKPRTIQYKSTEVQKIFQQSAITQSPPTPSYNFTTAICTIMKDAEAYLEEWIDCHLLGVEFDNIYIYDNSPHFDLRHWYQNTREDPVYSRVQVTHYPKKRDQRGPMSECIKRFGQDKNGPKHDYIAHIDNDEFFVIPGYPNTYRDIKGVLQDYLVPYGGALIVSWMMVGTDHKSVYSPLPVTKRFQYREAEPNSVIKTIVKSSDFKRMQNPHSAIIREGTVTHTTLEPGYIFKTSSQAKASDPNPATKILLLYHFRYTSEKECLAKRCVRGGIVESWCTADGKLKTNGPEHIQPRPGTVFDNKPWRLLTSKVPKYRMYDQFRDFH